jgi:hypothetical protein
MLSSGYVCKSSTIALIIDFLVCTAAGSCDRLLPSQAALSDWRGLLFINLTY